MSKTSSTEEFIEKAKLIHGNKYDYSKVKYIKNDENVIIICPKHGEFSQTPHNHLRGQNCPFCSHRSFKYTLEEFIEKAREIHGDKYDYSKVDYVDNKTNVTIICPIHGEFQKTPKMHIHLRQGCQRCKKNNVLEENVRRFLQHKNENFEEQKRFKWLGKLSLDFYLPQYSIAIECQGKQHFGLGGWIKDKEERKKQYKIQQLRDKRKRDLCEKHGIKILYYSNLRINYPYEVYTNLEDLFSEIKNGE